MGGSLETAVKGEYNLEIGAIRREAWKLTKGNKGIIWLALLVMGSVFFGGNYLLAELGVPDGSMEMESGEFFIGYSIATLKGLLLIPITAPLMVGFWFLCIKRAANIEVWLGEIFSYFGRMPAIIIVSLLSTLLMYTGIALLVLPGIYLMVAYAFAAPLMLDKKLSPWQSMEASRKAVTHHWFKVFGVFLLLSVILVLSMFTVIGIIWALPMSMLGYASLYITIFGISEDAGVVVEVGEVSPQ
jgi:hypothetical protein